MINKICEFQLKKNTKKNEEKNEYKKKTHLYMFCIRKNELFSFKFVSLFTRYLSIIGFD